MIKNRDKKTGKARSDRHVLRSWLGKTLFFGFMIALVWSWGVSVYEDRKWLEKNTDLFDASMEFTTHSPIASADINTRTKLKQKIEELENDVVNKIRHGESHGRTSENGEVLFTLDPSSSQYHSCRRVGGWQNVDCLSFGVMQMKPSTVERWYKQLHGEAIGEREAIMLALDDKKATEFAKRVIIEIEGSVFEWSVAQKDPSYYNEVVPLIRELRALLD